MLRPFDKELFSQTIVATRLFDTQNKPGITQENLISEVKNKLKLSLINDPSTLNCLANSKLNFYDQDEELDEHGNFKKPKKDINIRLEDYSILEIESAAKLLGFSTESYITLLAFEGGYLNA